MDGLGVTLESLLDAALHDSKELEALVRKTRDLDHVRLLLDVVSCQQFLSMERLVFAWVSALWGSVRDLLLLDIGDHSPDAAFDGRIQAMLNRLARLMARDPSRIPNQPPRPKNRPDDLDDRLGRSLL